jgi:lambda family phage portal protein
MTDDLNRSHWIMADGLSARTANTWAVRWQLRSRARYEVANNTYAKGMVLTLANDTIGTGPRIQCLTKDTGLNRAIELEFTKWARAIKLAEKLHTMRQARTVDGEVFGIFITNPGVPGDVQLDLRIIEGDQVHTPALNPIDPYKVDGIEFDEFYNPQVYHVLKFHPGDVFPQPWVFQLIPARDVIHWFRSDRPGQMRGVPDITPALPLFAQLRRYTLATISAAETAANFAATLQTPAPANPDDQVWGEPFEHLSIERNTMTTLPAGYSMSQFRPEQPTTTYPEFKSEILNEIARCLNIPYNVAAGNSSGYNYSSGRLDHQVYFKSIRIDQAHIELAILDRVFQHWIDEVSLATDLLPGGPERLEGYPHKWFWDGHGHVDPEKEAKAQETRLRNYTTTLADEYARAGQDWRSAIKQRAEELEFIEGLGMPPAGTSPLPPAEKPEGAPGSSGQDGESNGEDQPHKSNGTHKRDLSEQNGKPARHKYPRFDENNDREADY